MKRLALASVSAIVALGVAEVALTALDLPGSIGSIDFFAEELGSADVFAADGDLFWRLRPDTDRYLVNRVGFRGSWPAREKDASDLRIACVGDSCTFGTEVRYEDTWGKRLERLLQERFPHRAVESLLAGMPGFSSFQSVRTFETLVLSERPDLTVLYVGAWNDYADAIQRNDPDTWHGLNSSAPRSWRILRELTAPTGGPRVPLESFRRSVRALVESARSVESHVLVVLPPLPDSTYETHPRGREYRRALVEVCGELDVPTVDGTELFEPYRTEVKSWVPALQDRWPMFQDFVHPTAYGYDVLARALAARVAPWFEDGAARESSVRIDTVQWNGEQELLVRGSGFGSGEIDRVHWGDWFLPVVEVLDPTTLRLSGWSRFPAGEAALELLGPGGVLSRSGPLRVRPPALSAVHRAEDGVPILEVNGRLRPNEKVYLFLAPELRGEPAGTRYGPFHLATPKDGRPPGHTEGPFELFHLPLPRFDAACDEYGTLAWRTRLDPSTLADGIETVYVQGLVADGSRYEYAVLTPVLSVPLER